MSKTASNELWSLAVESIPKMIEARERENITKKIPQFRSVRESLHRDNVPRIRLEVAYECKETGDIIILRDLESTPVNRFPPSQFQKLYETARVDVSFKIDIYYSLKQYNFNPFRSICKFALEKVRK